MSEDIKAVEEQHTEAEIDSTVQEMLSGASAAILEQGMTPFVFANDQKNPNPFGLLNMFYNGVFTNTMGIMVAQDKDDNDSEKAVIVGISKSETGDMVIYPVALVLGEDAVRRFRPPNGKGGYVDV